MSELAATLVKALVAFVSTNVDDIVLLSVLFADPQLRARSVVVGQFLGMGILVLLSGVASFASVAVPPEWIALLGAIPLGLGVYRAIGLLRSRGKRPVEEDEPRPTARASAVLAVAGVTLANGGDNLGLYIPLFAADRRRIMAYVVVFTALTAVWCALGFELVDNEAFGRQLRRAGHLVLPIVLLALGLHILAGARSLVPL